MKGAEKIHNKVLLNDMPITIISSKGLKFNNFKSVNYLIGTQEILNPTFMQNCYFPIIIAFLVCGGSLSIQAQSLRDADGNIYRTITIGKQVWMAENLKTTRYNDATSIPLIKDEKEWQALTTPGYCWLNNDEAINKNKFGALYNWYVVNTKKLCPKGWHVPSNEDWTALLNYLGGESAAGGKLKATGTTYWVSPNTGATNESGFTALPGGCRNHNGTFETSGSNVEVFRSNGCWWSSTELYSFNAYYLRLYHTLNSAYRSLAAKQFGFSVRCLKD